MMKEYKAHTIIRKAEAIYNEFLQWLNEHSKTDIEMTRSQLLKEITENKLQIIKMYYNDIIELNNKLNK